MEAGEPKAGDGSLQHQGQVGAALFLACLHKGTAQVLQSGRATGRERTLVCTVNVGES